MLRVIDSGGQAALLAPTEVLAQQHHRSITALLGDLAGGGMLGGAEEATTVTLLTGLDDRRPSAPRRCSTSPRARPASWSAPTRCCEEKVSFADLGLVVVDEQHRFGVEQRAALADKALMPPHVLVMTATPIPRTVAMTVFGDLEVSTLTELPAGRAPIQTTVVPLAEQPVVDHPGVGARARGGREGSPGLRRLPAHRRRPGRAGRARRDRPRRGRHHRRRPRQPLRRHRRRGRPARRAPAGAARRRPARAARRRGEGAHDAGLRRRRARRPGLAPR